MNETVVCNGALMKTFLLMPPMQLERHNNCASMSEVEAVGASCSEALCSAPVYLA